MGSHIKEKATKSQTNLAFTLEKQNVFSYDPKEENFPYTGNMVRFTEDLLSQIVESFCLKQKIPLRKLLFYIEKTLLFKALRESNGNQREAARLLGMKHTTLHEKVKKYGIQFEKRPLVD